MPLARGTGVGQPFKVVETALPAVGTGEGSLSRGIEVEQVPTLDKVAVVSLGGEGGRVLTLLLRL